MPVSLYLCPVQALQPALSPADSVKMEMHDPQFWLALVFGLVVIGLFIYWLRSGARKS